MNKRDIPRLAAVAVAAFVAAMLFPSVGYAELPDPLAPRIVFDSGGKTHYDSAQQLLSIDASAIIALLTSPFDPPASIVRTTTGTGSIACPECDYGAFTIRARVNNSGALVGGVAGADLSIVGKVVDLFGGPPIAEGELLTGEVQHFEISSDNRIFRLRFSITGGALKDLGYFNKCGSSLVALCDFDAPVEITLPPGSTLTGFTGTGSFLSIFDGGAVGEAGAIQPLGFYDPSLDQCTGRVDGFVWNDVNHNGIPDAGELALEGFPLTLSGGLDSINSALTTSAAGLSSFTSLCAGNYTLQVDPLATWEATTSISTGVVTLGAGGSLTFGFGFYVPPPPPPPPIGPFRTFTQGGWGSKPKRSNPGQLLADHYSDVYGAGAVVIGGNFTVTMTGPLAIQRVLPQNGRPSALTMDYTDPVVWIRPRPRPHTRLGELMGQVLALRLNTDFSSWGGVPGMSPGFGALEVKFGPLAGWTVNGVLEAGNMALGGGSLPGGVTLQQLTKIIERINHSYPGGTPTGFVGPAGP